MTRGLIRSNTTADFSGIHCIPTHKSCGVINRTVNRKIRNKYFRLILIQILMALFLPHRNKFNVLRQTETAKTKVRMNILSRAFTTLLSCPEENREVGS